MASGGPFAVMSKDWRMITRSPNKFVRDLLMQQSLTDLMTKTTSGKLSTMKGQTYTHTMDIRAFTSCAIPPHLARFLLAEDSARKTDLSYAFRMQRAIRGGNAPSTSIQIKN